MALVTEFLTGIRGLVIALDSDGLSTWLKVEPGLGTEMYSSLGQELKQGFSDSALDKLIDKCLPEDDDPPEGSGSPWPGFVSFIKEYLMYWKDLDLNNVLGVQESLCGLLTSCATALSHPTYGSLMFNTSISLSEALSKVVMLLNRQPELMRNRRTVAGDEDSKSMVEQSADIIQKIFTSCLTDRTSSRYAPPEGKKVGVYIFANLVLKLLFTCGKSRLASQLLLNISTSGPPLALFPAAQRVTFLYYLGRFNFDADNFIRASLCLQEAYLQTPPKYQQHRKLILTYLIPANIMLGRFPSELLLQRSEAATELAPVFRPLIAAVRKGNFIDFQQTIAAHKEWLYRKGLTFTLTYRLRPLVWRCFIRRTFLLTYVPPTPDPMNAAKANNAAVTLNLADLVTTANYVQKRIEGYIHRAQSNNGNGFFMNGATNNNNGGFGDDAASTLVPPPGGPRDLMPSEGLFWGNLPVTPEEIEGVVTGLVAQGLLRGFVAHSSARFAIVGVKQYGGPLAAGWPNIAQVLVERLTEEGVDVDEVPAWVKASL